MTSKRRGMGRRELLATGLGAACAALTPRPLRAAMDAADVQVQADTMLAMRDGVRLATDVYRPLREGAGERLPALLHRTPYDKSAAATVATARELARQGYVVVVQDTRGRHRSEGVFEKYYAYDAYDGFDTIEWVAKQPFSDGKVGMFGTSYAAHTQADAAKLSPPHLRTMVLNMGGMANAWDHSVRNDGAFEVGRQFTWAWEQALADTKNPVARALLTKEKENDWYAAMPLKRGESPLAVEPVYEGYYFDEATHADYGPYWQTLGMQWERFYAQTADVPMLHIGGWYDIYLRGTIANFRELGRLKKSPMHLLIGPWTHHGNTASYAGDVDFGPEAALADFDTGFHLRWFDFHLKGAATAVAKQAPVRYFLMGTGDGGRTKEGRLRHGGEWREAAVWPPAEAKPATFYLHGDGSLQRERPAGKGAASTTYGFDPAHPVPTIGGGVSKRLKDGAYDQRERPDMPGSRAPYLPLKSRADVLVFETAPLAEDLVVAGPVEVTLYVASTGVDTDFTAKLLDVHPPSEAFPQGFDMNLTDGILRASYRDGSKTRTLLKPGEVYRLTLRPYDTANVFRKGHRLRVDISSSNFPRFDVNPNTGEPLGESRRLQAVDNTVFHEAARASCVTLHVMPAKA